jgi:hypothetical protein
VETKGSKGYNEVPLLSAGHQYLSNSIQQIPARFSAQPASKYPLFMEP